MSTDTVSGKFDQVVGKAKQGIGEATGNQELANSGAADQVKGNAKEAWGNVKDTASDVRQQRPATQPASRDAAKHRHARSPRQAHLAAENLKDKITGKTDEVRDATIT